MNFQTLDNENILIKFINLFSGFEAVSTQEINPLEQKKWEEKIICSLQGFGWGGEEKWVTLIGTLSLNILSLK